MLIGILKTMEQKYASEEINTIDGVKIDFEENWVHSKKVKYRTHYKNLYRSKISG